MEGKVVLGQLVKSSSGRDCGRFYLVMEVTKEGFVFVADGIVRRLENPKKKNIKHINSQSIIAEEIAEKLNNGKRINNTEVLRAIQRLVVNPEE